MLDLTMGTILLKDTRPTDAFFFSTSPSFFPFFLQHSWCEVLQRKMKGGESGMKSWSLFWLLTM